MQDVKPRKGGSGKAWVVSVGVNTTMCVRVFAETEEEATEIALSEASPSVCHQCSDVLGGDFNIDEESVEAERDESHDLKRGPT